MLCFAPNVVNVHLTIFTVEDQTTYIVNRYFYGLNDETQLRTAGFLSELISVRDGTLELSNEFNISREELNVIISHVCTQ